MAKATSGIVIAYPSLIFLIIIAFVVNMPIKLILAFFITANLALVATNLIGIISDVTKPKLNWDNEAVAVKQNFRSLISTLLSIGIAVGVGFGLTALDLSFWSAFGLLLVVFGGLSGILYFIIRKTTVKWFEGF